MKQKKDIGFGLFYTPQLQGTNPQEASFIYEKITEQAQLAESLGWQNIWLSEHHGVPFGGIINSPEILGAYIAAKTSKIRIGPAISALPFHDPRVIAERYAMLDQLSLGRLDMGVGRGFLAKEFEVMGVSMEESKPRFEEALKVLSESWKEKSITFKGDFFSYSNAQSLPKPYQLNQPPIWVAASKSTSSFNIAGKNGYNLMINPYTRDKSEIIEGIALYKNALKANGWDAKSHKIAAVQHLYIGELDSALISAFDNYLDSLVKSAQNSSSNGVDWKKHFEGISYEKVYPEKVLFGTAEEVFNRIQSWVDLGITDFCFITQFGDLSWNKGMHTIKELHAISTKINID